MPAEKQTEINCTNCLEKACETEKYKRFHEKSLDSVLDNVLVPYRLIKAK